MNTVRRTMWHQMRGVALTYLTRKDFWLFVVLMSATSFAMHLTGRAPRDPSLEIRRDSFQIRNQIESTLSCDGHQTAIADATSVVVAPETDTVVLRGPRIDDDVVKAVITQAPRLRQLYLHNTSVTDRGLVELSSLQRLETL